MLPGAGHEWARAAVEAALNGLWQGVLLAAVVAVGLSRVRGANAATRYAVWWLCLGAVVVLPAATYHWPGLAAAHWPLGAGRVPGGADAALLLPGGPWPELLLAAWLLGASALLGRVALGYRLLRRLKRTSEPLAARDAALIDPVVRRHYPGRYVRVRRSTHVRSPITAGLGDPMVLLPTELLGRLRPDDLRQIVLHELTHLRRRDDHATLVQRCLEALFFFHPAVIFLASRLDLEREIACDDRVVELTGRPKSYARCLARLAEVRPAGRAALASGAMLHRHQLVRRVTLLLQPGRRRGERVSSPLAALALSALLAAVVWLAGMTPLVGVPEAGEDAPVPGAAEVAATGTSAVGRDMAEGARATSPASPASSSPRPSRLDGVSGTLAAAPGTSPPVGNRGAPVAATGQAARRSRPAPRLLGVPVTRLAERSPQGGGATERRPRGTITGETAPSAVSTDVLSGSPDEGGADLLSTPGSRPRAGTAGPRPGTAGPRPAEPLGDGAGPASGPLGGGPPASGGGPAPRPAEDDPEDPLPAPPGPGADPRPDPLPGPPGLDSRGGHP